MTKETARKELDALLERLRVEQTIEDMQAEIEGRTQTASQPSVDKAMARVQASLDRFARGESAGVAESANQPASAIQSSWETLHTTLVWLTIPLEWVPLQAAGGSSRTPGEATEDNSLSVDEIAARAPEGLRWIPSRMHVPASGQMKITLAWTGIGDAVAPGAIDLRHNGNPIDAVKIDFDPDVDLLTILLAGIDPAPKTIGLAEQEDGSLTINFSESD